MRISVILPAYNEEERIEGAVKMVEEVLGKMNYDYEIIVVDDGSTDGTLTKALKCANGNNHVKVVSHQRNLGKGAAVRTGFMHSTGEIIVFMDSDLEISPESLPTYVKALKEADIAIGSKWHPQSRVETTLLRKFLSRGFYTLARLLVGVKVRDTQAGLKAFRREALEKIMKLQLVKHYAFDVELLAIASLLKLKVIELPVKMKLAAGFRIKDIYKMLVDLLGIAYRLRIKKWYQK